MHILLTNDDGPPSDKASPYIRYLARHLQEAGHVLSVCLPHTQRSWIGKAHMVGQTIRTFAYQPDATTPADGRVDSSPVTSQTSQKDAKEEWVLVDGTPASCVQIGLHHFFQDKGPIDLVISGPNYGRNTTAVFALSSGTLGAALEAAVCQKRSIALSFAFFSRDHDPEIINEACRHSVRVITALSKQWPEDGRADLYSVNVPLVKGVESNKTLWTDILKNSWAGGSCFQEIEGTADDENVEEEKIREGSSTQANDEVAAPSESFTKGSRRFKWAPRFGDISKTVEDAGPGSDGWAIKEGCTSVTPLKATFAAASGYSMQTELDLSKIPIKADTCTPSGSDPLIYELKDGDERLQATISYEDSYVQPLIVAAFKQLFSGFDYTLMTDLPSPSDQNATLTLPKTDSTKSKTLHVLPYETIDFDYASSHTQTCMINSYMIRKAVIRKHYLSNTFEHWVAKRPESVLSKHCKRSETFEVDYAEFLDDALVEAFDLRESMDKNSSLSDNTDDANQQKQWWILKPGMSDRGQGIRLFSTLDELQEIFDKWEADRPDSDDENGDVETDKQQAVDTLSELPATTSDDYITASHLRHFVAQPYIHPPLLLEGEDRKFHIRTYVLCVGSLRVFVYKRMLALFAAKPYTAPWTAPDDIESFLTNTCLQDSPNENSVREFTELPIPSTASSAIFSQICSVTGEVFEAAARASPIHFQTLPNAFEVFGLDFLVDAGGTAWLLEVNAFPDFKQTGAELHDLVGDFWKGVLRCAVVPFFGLESAETRKAEEEEDMILVRDIDLGRR